MRVLLSSGHHALCSVGAESCIFTGDRDLGAPTASIFLVSAPWSPNNTHGIGGCTQHLGYNDAETVPPVSGNES